MKALVVVAHPDDEVLGAGGTLAQLSTAGHDIHVLFMSGEVNVRERRPADGELDADIRAAQNRLGTHSVRKGPFPNIRMNTVDHVDLVKYVESAIREVEPSWIFTHHPNDLNDDHRQTSTATQAAARLHQRGNGGKPLRGLLFMEILSSTDWQFASTNYPFEPTAFFKIGTTGLATKVEALSCYRGVMRPYPHPRSTESLHALAILRGSQAGMEYAEAFQAVHIDLTGLL